MTTTNNKTKRLGKTVNKDMADRFPLTISKDLFISWQKNRRAGDATQMIKKIKVSRPILDRALNYGNVKSDKLTKDITKFFADRIAAESAMVRALEVEGA